MRDNERRKIGEQLRGRNNYNSTSASGIGSIWADQKQAEREEAELQKQYREAKKQAKELRKSLIKNQIGDDIQHVSKFYDKSKNKFISVFSVFKKRKHYKLAVSMAAVLVAVFVGYKLFSSDNNSSDILGDSTSASIPIADDLPREKPAFKLLFPDGAKSLEYDVVRISPPEADASYTYLDRFTDDGQIFRVTQQEIPDSFDLAKTATDFQATSIIQVDDNIIYHGYSEKGGVQSVLFIKDNKLISIRSPQKFNDDQWAGYFLSLK